MRNQEFDSISQGRFTRKKSWSFATIRLICHLVIMKILEEICYYWTFLAAICNKVKQFSQNKLINSLFLYFSDVNLNFIQSAINFWYDFKKFPILLHRRTSYWPKLVVWLIENYRLNSFTMIAVWKSLSCVGF